MKRFLRKLINLNIWGGRHTELKELLNKGFLTIKMSTGEYHISLNSHKQKEIYEFLENFDERIK